ncbi:hypothetical protein [Quadrisphaera setariae]|uniref:Uncharacterized protein n=1 Tax=Quadrisphaera setariae TaxID=2593304 RepID=A0A5C8ZFB6_9ACTN|nr:hypothetical protein [Quadrisphaera setariae]TXR56184.1 hypothetical protein FMM08_12260 [Quadrisphaera setariae]
MAGVDVLVVAGAWALGSVAVSLAVGAVVSRAQGPSEARATQGPRPSVPVLALAVAARHEDAPRALALPAPRTSAERLSPTA